MDQLKWMGAVRMSRVGYLWIIMFLFAFWTLSDGTHLQQRIHWWASDLMLNFSKPV